MTVQTINVQLNLSPEKINILNSLESSGKISMNQLIADLVNGKTNWEDLSDINDAMLIKNNPNTKYFSSKEASEYLKNI